MYDLIIIGSGPAGLSAAVYGKRAGLQLRVLEKNPMSGGQILNTYEVDNYLGLSGIGGFEMGMKFREHADKLGVEFKEAFVTAVEDEGSVKKVVTKEGVLEAKAVILAMGAEHARLGIPGEEALTGKGVSYCATCDGAFFRGKTTAVIGGGDVALEDAIYLARMCEKVYVVHRRDEFRGAKILQEELFGLPNVEILYHHTAKEILGEDMVERLVLTDLEKHEEKQLAVDGVFVAVGIRPNTENFAGYVDADEAGYLLAGEDCACSVPGIFAAGDVRQKPLRQVVTAVADGANAAVSAVGYLNKVLKNY